MILVDIYVPSLNKVYDFRLNEELRLRTVTDEIADAIGRKEHSRIKGNREQMILCGAGKKIILNPDLTLKEQGIGNGERLIIV